MEKDYEVLCTLGEGSFGKVYKARHRRSGDEVAVKQIKIGSRSWDEACRSTELQALKALRHPFLVKLKELIRGQKDGSLYYIFEFLDSDLCHLLKYNPSGLEEIRAAALIRQLFAGLTHMHQHCYFHRDIKPENILLDASTESIRIADFGQARSIRALPPFTDYVGTRWYRAPECLLRDRSYSSPVDIWASGLIFAELLRGSPVFCGNSSIDQLYKIFTVLGPPSNDWPDFARLTQALRFRVPDRCCGLVRVLPQCTPKCVGFLSEILVVNPRRRPLAKKCLEHVYFCNLTPLDLDVQSQVSQSSRVDPERLDTPPLLPQVVCEDAFEFNDRRPSKESRRPSKETKEAAVSICEGLATDLDLDAELDAILGDAGNDYAYSSELSSPPRRACNRSSSLPNLTPKIMSQERPRVESMHSKRGFANYNLQPHTVATAEDHLDRLLESLDIDDETEVETKRLVGKIEIDRLPSMAVAKVEADRLARGAAVANEKMDIEVGFVRPLPLVSPSASESSVEIDVRNRRDGTGVGAVRPASATMRPLQSDVVTMAVWDPKKSNHGIGYLERSEHVSPFLQPNLTKLHSHGIDFKNFLASKTPGKGSDLRNASIAGASTDDGELHNTSLKGRAWTTEEAKRLRKVVKATIRMGTRDKTALWLDVSHELGSGRTAKECKLQYARDYRAHKAKPDQEGFLDVENAT